MKPIRIIFIRVVLLFLCLGLTNCQNVNVPDLYYKNIFGKWRLIQITNLKTNNMETHQYTDHVKFIEFTKKGNFCETIDNIKGVDYKYSFGNKTSVRNKEAYYINFRNYPISKEKQWTNLVILQNRDTLYFDDSEFSGIISMYIKIK